MAAPSSAMVFQGNPISASSTNSSSFWGQEIVSHLSPTFFLADPGLARQQKLRISVSSSAENYSLAATVRQEFVETKRKDHNLSKKSIHSAFPDSSKEKISDFPYGEVHENEKNDTEFSSRPFYGHNNSTTFVNSKTEKPPSSTSSMIQLSRGEWEDRAYKLLQQRRMRRMKAEKEGKLSSEENSSRASMPPQPSAEETDPSKLKHSHLVSKLKMKSKISTKETKPFLFSQLNSTSNSEQVKMTNYELLSKELGKKGRWHPLIEFLVSQGLTQSDFERIIFRHKSCLLLNVSVVKKRLDFLRSLGVNQCDIPKLILRHPQILEYSIERTMQSRVDYFSTLNIHPPELGRVVSLAPALLQCSVEKALKPRVRYLQEIVGVRNEDISKVVQRSPQILAQSIENSLAPRVRFFREEVQVSFKELATMVTRHPQLLHYSIDKGMKPRINFLLSIGVPKHLLGKVLTRLTQILSLSVENSLRPKFEYLVNELGGDVDTITSFPAYFSLSLELRIKPRYLYLISLKKRIDRPFPMKLLAVTDSAFCRHVGCPSEEHYQEFKEELLRNRNGESII